MSNVKPYRMFPSSRLYHRINAMLHPADHMTEVEAVAPCGVAHVADLPHIRNR